jgi:hypothetical protein
VTPVAMCEEASGAGSGSRFITGITAGCWKLSFLFLQSNLVDDPQFAIVVPHRSLTKPALPSKLCWYDGLGSMV